MVRGAAGRPNSTRSSCWSSGIRGSGKARARICEGGGKKVAQLIEAAVNIGGDRLRHLDSARKLRGM
jgi:hypothetical protein